MKVDQLIKLANLFIQKSSPERNGKDDSNSYFWKQKIS